MEYEGKDHPVRCLQCGDEITYGRAGKKFCCEECKNRYHNRQTNADRAFRTRVNGILERNHHILEGFLREGEEACDLMDALSLGFNPAFVTSFRKVRTRMSLTCYDIGYPRSDNRISGIHKIRNDSVNLYPENKIP